MREMKPEHIPEVISTVAAIYAAQRSPTKEEDAQINKFFANYMDKAFSDCTKESILHWNLPRKDTDIALKLKTVEIKAGTAGNKVQFIVVTSFSPKGKFAKPEEFTEAFKQALLEQFSNEPEGDWLTVYNKLHTSVMEGTLARSGAAMLVRFSKEFFQEAAVH